MRGSIVNSAVVTATVAAPPPAAGPGGTGPRHRPGPEYERALARHGGGARTSGRPPSDGARALSTGDRERYERARAAVRERGADAAVAEAAHVPARLVHARGLPSDANVANVANAAREARETAPAERAGAGGTDTEGTRAVPPDGRGPFRESTAAGPGTAPARGRYGYSAPGSGSGTLRRRAVRDGRVSG